MIRVDPAVASGAPRPIFREKAIRFGPAPVLFPSRWCCEVPMHALRHYFRVRFTMLPVLEALVLAQSMVVGFELRATGERIAAPGVTAIAPGIYGVSFAILMLLVMTAFGLYDRHTDPFRLTVRRVFSAYLVTLLLAAATFVVFPEVGIERDVFAVATVFALFGVVVIRYSAYRARNLHLPSSRVLVVGSAPACEDVARLLRTPGNGRAARLKGQVRVGCAATGDGGAGRMDLPAVVREQRISEIVVALDDRRGGQEPLAQLLACRLMGVRVLDLQTFHEREQGLIKLEHLRTSWLIYGSGFDQSRLRAAVKRAFDIAAALALVIAASPAMLAAAAAIRLESKGPVLFRQERVRDSGAPFMMLKFRSMRQDAEKDGTPRWASATDDRITRVGRIIRRLRIDELPQLLNVLKGDMSFVGPRPERPFFVAQLCGQIPFYELRHNVRPGITGWAQVRMQYGASVEDAKAKLEYDLYYVKNHSLFLDLMILLETVQVVLLGKGAR
jgi:sugar transferase (PEP-CTERM system associated)